MCDCANSQPVHIIFQCVACVQFRRIHSFVSMRSIVHGMFFFSSTRLFSAIELKSPSAHRQDTEQTQLSQHMKKRIRMSIKKIKLNKHVNIIYSKLMRFQLTDSVQQRRVYFRRRLLIDFE